LRWWREGEERKVKRRKEGRRWKEQKKNQGKKGKLGNGGLSK
jgi:hypothetical protein